MPGSAYDRYGLTSNPFRDLSSESLGDVDLYHVNLDVDRTLDTIREEVLEKENRAFVALVGLHGAGKTERLFVAQAQAKERQAFCVYFDVTTKTTWVVKGIAEAIAKRANLGGFRQLFGAPRWFRDLSAMGRLKDQNYDPIRAGRALAEALNANVPAFLLLNDLHNLATSSERGLFAKTLQELVDGLRPGALVMFGCFPSFLLQLAAEQPPLSSRINRTITLPRVTSEEAALLLAKKLLAKRLVDGLDPLYPFDREAVERLNQMAWGNPRRLLELADVAIEYAVTHRAYRIDTELVRTALLEHQVQDMKTAVETKAEGWQEELGPGEGPPPVGPTAAPSGRGPVAPSGSPTTATAPVQGSLTAGSERDPPSPRG